MVLVYCTSNTVYPSLVAVFRHQPVQFSPLEEDADRDDDPSPLDTEEAGQEEETELQRLSRRPWGVSKHYCPVVLRDQEVLWPGNPDHALRYRDRLYYFSTEEAKQVFEGHAPEYSSCVQKVSITQRLPLYTHVHIMSYYAMPCVLCMYCYGCIETLCSASVHMFVHIVMVLMRAIWLITYVTVHQHYLHLREWCAACVLCCRSLPYECFSLALVGLVRPLPDESWQPSMEYSTSPSGSICMN